MPEEIRMVLRSQALIKMLCKHSRNVNYLFLWFFTCESLY